MSQRFVVTTSGDRALEDIQKDLTDAGFNVEETLEHIGCIIGNADDEIVNQSLQIKGITDISPEETAYAI